MSSEHAAVNPKEEKPHINRAFSNTDVAARNKGDVSGASFQADRKVDSQSTATSIKNHVPAPVLTQHEKDSQLIRNLRIMLATEKRFSSRTRLFFGNVPVNATDEEMQELFRKYGDVKEYYVNRDRGWGFIKMDYKISAEIAKHALDNFSYKGRYLRVKFATHGSAVEVHGLGPFTSDELLAKAFAFFGDVERATVMCDQRGRPQGFGIVEFGWKKPANVALSRVNEGFFVIGRSPKPVTVKLYDQNDATEGVREKDVQRSQALSREREYPPRFVRPGMPEYIWCEKWKEYEALAKEKRDKVEVELKEIRDKLEHDMEADLVQQESDAKHQEQMQREEETQLQDDMRHREEMLHRELLLAHRREMEIRGQDNSMLREELRQQEFRRQEEFIRRQQVELEMRKRETAEEIMRETALRLQAVVEPSGKPHDFPLRSSFSPMSPRGMGQGPRMHMSPALRPGGGLRPPLPMGNSPRGLPHHDSLHPPRREFPSRLDGFFGSKRPRMF